MTCGKVRSWSKLETREGRRSSDAMLDRLVHVYEEQTYDNSNDKGQETLKEKQPEPSWLTLNTTHLENTSGK